MCISRGLDNSIQWFVSGCYFMKNYTESHKKENYTSKAVGLGTELKAEEEVDMKVTPTTVEIIQQIMEAQFKQFRTLLSKNMEMMVKLMKEQAAAPAPVPTAGCTLKPTYNHKCTHCIKYKYKGGNANAWNLWKIKLPTHMDGWTYYCGCTSTNVGTGSQTSSCLFYNMRWGLWCVLTNQVSFLCNQVKGIGIWWF